MQYRTFGYHGSKEITKPRLTDSNIKGIELEIGEENQYDEQVNDKLDELIEKNILKAPSNEYEKNNKNNFTIAIEDDASVFKELVIKASCNRTLLKAVKLLEKELHNIVENDQGTSCHIHLNNRYLRKNGLKNTDIIKSAEFIAPILYEISGRDINSIRWCKSRIPKNIESFNLYERGVYLDNKNEDTYSNERYSIVNMGPSYGKTTEIRIFSNYFDFNYEYIKLYIEISDFIVEIAKYMKNKEYEKEYDNLIQKIFDFFNKRNRKKFFENHNIKRFLIQKDKIKIQTLKEELRYFNNEIEALNQREYINEIQRLKSFIRICRNYANRYRIPDIEFNLCNIDNDIENNISIIRNNITEQIQEEE